MAEGLMTASEGQRLTPLSDKLTYLVKAIPAPGGRLRWTDSLIVEHLAVLGIVTGRAWVQRLRTQPNTQTDPRIIRALEQVFGIREGSLTEERIWSEDQYAIECLTMIHGEVRSLLTQTRQIDEPGRAALDAIVRLTTGIVAPRDKTPAPSVDSPC